MRVPGVDAGAGLCPWCSEMAGRDHEEAQTDVWRRGLLAGVAPLQCRSVDLEEEGYCAGKYRCDCC